MNLDKVDKKFVSEADRYLTAFNAEHAKTPSQLAEIAKHHKVFQKRDSATAQAADTGQEIWEDF